MNSVAKARNSQLVPPHYSACQSYGLVKRLPRWDLEVLRKVDYAVLKEDDWIFPSQRRPHHESGIPRGGLNVYSDARGAQKQSFPPASRLAVLWPVEVRLDYHSSLQLSSGHEVRLGDLIDYLLCCPQR